ncbi:AAA family ATPase [Nocardia gipuzkoensis]|uniref:bifunctional aminoglycoside phosphotransferase/ATP-binding protein n=1 Tax=Nocardia gipuzkoensis TaxID=2749991 RepID=UPI001E44F14F|nr:AAA family ATPase [Nocardia gipuzkoensis]UGT67825.1 AAA family ATPase [Nocardia gipuzkoensis]
MLDVSALRAAPAMFNAQEPFAQLRETHTGLVVLCGDRAYKAKKPVVTDFLDFGTPENRERACARELELNQRLAPDVYLGLAHLTDPEGGADEPIIVMRRMPEASRLSATLAEPARDAVELSALAETLARFHAGGRRDADIDRAGTPAQLRRRWENLLRPLQQYPHAPSDPSILARAEYMAVRYIDGRTSLLTERIADGRMVDGHGDLLAEDIFVLPDGFRILDCLDFDDELRYVDSLDDAAFLAMDLEFLGYPEQSDAFLNCYLRAAGDSPPPSLRHHYIAYRAMVRAKTDHIRADQGDVEAAGRAERHLDLAVEHLEQGAVRLVLVGGLPGTGKSTVAARLAAATGAVVISSDSVRAELRTTGSIAGAAGVFGAGAYRSAAKALVYAQMLEQARQRLERGVSVILDASWTDSDQRARAAALADETRSDLVPLRCVCPQPLAAERISARPQGDSDATPAIAAALAATVTPWPEAIVLDTAQPIEGSIGTALDAWRGAVVPAAAAVRRG